MHVDLCLVKFNKKIQDLDSGDMWCFNPQPTIAMEFKYLPDKLRGDTFDKDIESLSTMGDLYGAQLLYLCFATYEEAALTKAQELIWSQLVKVKRSVRSRFRIAVGTLVKSNWKTLKLSIRGSQDWI